MNDKKHLRKKLLVNRDVQGAIICRTVLHWFFYLAAIVLIVVVFKVWEDPSQMAIRLVFSSFVDFAPAVIASVVLLPLMVYDTLKETHRVAGPIYRLQCEMQRLTNGKQYRELRFRDGDHWYNVADTFNELAKQYDDQRSENERLKAELARASQRSLVN